MTAPIYHSEDLPHLSFTGINNNTISTALVKMTEVALGLGVRVEWGVLHFIEKEGMGRNPSFNQMMEFADRLPCAAHLCGRLVFDLLLNRYTRPQVLRYLLRFNRVQLNINARGREFSDEDVKRLYQIMLEECDIPLILQYQPLTAPVIDGLFRPAPTNWPRERISILMDASMGRGVVPESWDFSSITRDGYERVSVGVAGGLNPDNFVQQMDLAQEALNLRRETLLEEPIIAFNDGVYYDMESGIQRDPQERTICMVDLTKVLRIIEAYSNHRLQPL
jgi:hypothetical protein